MITMRAAYTFLYIQIKNYIYSHKQINKKLMNAKYKQLEEAILKEADLLIEKAKSQGEKALYNLFKSAILKKYRNQYDVDIQQGEVKKETVDNPPALQRYLVC